MSESGSSPSAVSPSHESDAPPHAAKAGGPRRLHIVGMRMLVVSGCLGVCWAFAALAYFEFFLSEATDQDYAVQSGLATLSTALMAHKNRNGGYPESLAGLTDAAGGKRLLDAEVLRDPWGEEFVYERLPIERERGPFLLYSKGPDKVAGTADDVGLE